MQTFEACRRYFNYLDSLTPANPRSRANGAIGAGCHHNGCVDNDWHALRELVEPGWRKASNRPRAESEWPDPKPIQSSLHPVSAFDGEVLLPSPLRSWIMDEAGRMPCPPDFVAVAALVSIGAIIGARCAMKPKHRDDWPVVPNIWGGVVAPPSALKSPALLAGLKPQDRLVAKAMKAHREQLEDFESKKTIFEAETQALENELKAAAKIKSKKSNGSNVSTLAEVAAKLQSHRRQAPHEPTLRRYKTNDCTVEKLGELLRDNPAGMLVERDELVGLIASWEREGREGERAFFLEAWNGNSSFDVDRIKRGHIHIPNLCAAILGGIQPDKLTVYLEQAAHALSNDGMLQRFQLLVYPDHQDWEWRDRIPSKDARDREFEIFEKLADFDPVDWGAAPADDFNKFPHFHFDNAGQEIFIEWSTELHRFKLPAADNPLMAQHLAKYDKLFPALALIFHLVDCAATNRRGPVTKEPALMAAAWCEYLETHARRCYGLLADEGLRSAQALAEKIVQGRLKDEFTARDVRRNQWRSLTTDEAVQSALDWLEDEGWLWAEKFGGNGPGTGRQTWKHWINPKALKTIKAEKDYDKVA